MCHEIWGGEGTLGTQHRKQDSDARCKCQENRSSHEIQTWFLLNTVQKAISILPCSVTQLPSTLPASNIPPRGKSKSWSIRRLINHIILTQEKKRLQSTTLSTQFVEFSCQCIQFSYQTNVAWVCDRNEKLLAFIPFCRKIGKQQNGIRPCHFLIQLRGEISKGYLIKCASMLLVNRDVVYSKANK